MIFVTEKVKIEKKVKINLFVIYYIYQSGRKFSKTKGIEIVKKSVMES